MIKPRISKKLYKNIFTKCQEHYHNYMWLQKQTLRGVLRKRCSENMQQVYRKTPMPKCNFNKVAKATLLKLHFGMGVLLKIGCIFSEPLFLRTPLKGCLCA